MDKRIWVAALALACAAPTCAASDDSSGGGMGLPGGPTEPAPTGSKWKGVKSTDECGRTTMKWVLVDEICEGTDDPEYLSYFRAPIFRDAAEIGSTLFAVDGTHLWVLDATNASAISRQALIGGLGQPLAAAQHAGRLLLAAGSEGLIVVDVNDPLEPKRAATVKLPGPALDVSVDGDRAVVAMGHQGVAVVSLTEPPVFQAKYYVPGFAAAVHVVGDLVYVAACETFAILDVGKGNLLGQTWLSGASQDGILVAPAKDVTVVENTAFVAAGRFGAVAIDVTTPEAPTVEGNCLVSDPGFYASGVRHDAERLFVAGGEWGILPVPIASPPSSCPSLSPPPGLPPPKSDECGLKPPWEVVDWQTQYAPPLPGKDPVQTLPAGERVYAFGDASRVGLRAIDVRLPTTLDKIGRYEEPRLVNGIAEHAGRVLVTGKAGRVFTEVADGLLAPEPGAAPAVLLEATSATFLEDGRWVVSDESGQIFVEGSSATLTAKAPEHARLAADGIRVLYVHGAMLTSVDVDTGEALYFPLPENTALPPALLPTPEGLVVAAPEWTRAAMKKASAFELLGPHQVFGAEDALDVSLWLTAAPRRLLARSSLGLVEVASIGPRVGVALHEGQTTTGAELPSGEYVCAQADEAFAVLVAAHRGAYTSQIVTVSLEDGLVVTSVEQLTGVAVGCALHGNRLYVADADRGIVVYARAQGKNKPLGVVELSP